MTSSVQVLGVSNAILEVLAHVDDEFLAQIGVCRRCILSFGLAPFTTGAVGVARCSAVNIPG